MTAHPPTRTDTVCWAGQPAVEEADIADSAVPPLLVCGLVALAADVGLCYYHDADHRCIHTGGRRCAADQMRSPLPLLLTCGDCVARNRHHQS
jgi:ABC-type uncharacterized transport system YnjBCD permease subunit